MIEQLERIPEAGDSFVSENLSVTVTQVDTKRVMEICIVVNKPEEEEEAQ